MKMNIICIKKNKGLSENLKLDNFIDFIFYPKLNF